VNNQDTPGGGKQPDENEDASNAGRDMGRGGDAPSKSGRDGEEGCSNDGTGCGVPDGVVDKFGFGPPHITVVRVEFDIGQAHSPNLQNITLERLVKV